MSHDSHTTRQTSTVGAPQQVIERTLAVLERQIDDLMAARPSSLDLNLGAVQIIDSHALTWLISLQGRLETLGTTLRLVNPSSIMADVLLATRLDSRFPIGNASLSESNGDAASDSGGGRR